MGSKGNGPGQFDGPHGIAIDSHDNIYVTDMRIVEFKFLITTIHLLESGDLWKRYRTIL